MKVTFEFEIVGGGGGQPQPPQRPKNTAAPALPPHPQTPGMSTSPLADHVRWCD